MTKFETWCKETGYNPHTFEALDAYREHMNATGQRVGELEAELDETEGALRLSINETKASEAKLAEKKDWIELVEALRRATMKMWYEEIARRQAAEAKVEELERGEYICKQCGLRKNSEFTPGDF